MDPQAVAPVAELQHMAPEVLSAVIAAAVAVVIALVSVIVQVALWFLDKKAQRRHERMEHRRAALLSALQVIDHVYANTPFNGKPPANPHTWPIAQARDAMNGMIVFCENPNRAIAAFSKAIGLHNPAAGAPPPFGPVDLDAFRRVICEELNVTPPNYANNDVVWINTLSGGA
jgi:hypothetical protein